VWSIFFADLFKEPLLLWVPLMLTWMFLGLQSALKFSTKRITLGRQLTNQGIFFRMGKIAGDSGTLPMTPPSHLGFFLSCFNAVARGAQDLQIREIGRSTQVNRDDVINDPCFGRGTKIQRHTTRLATFVRAFKKVKPHGFRRQFATTPIFLWVFPQRKERMATHAVIGQQLFMIGTQRVLFIRAIIGKSCFILFKSLFHINADKKCGGTANPSTPFDGFTVSKRAGTRTENGFCFHV
jgi:hypothetical protein